MFGKAEMTPHAVSKSDEAMIEKFQRTAHAKGVLGLVAAAMTAAIFLVGFAQMGAI